MRVFVTGATGTVGREVVRALLAYGADVRAGARAPGSDKARLPDACEVVPFDFHDDAVDPAVFDGVDAFFFMTPLIEDQVAVSQRILDAVAKSDVGHVVRLSSRSAGWDQCSVLCAWHREIDEAVRGSVASWTVLRPCSFFQNFIRYQGDMIRNMSSIIVPQGDGLIAYIDATDIGEAAAQCLLRPKLHHAQTYVLTGGRAYGVKGVAAEIGRVLGRPLTYISIEEDRGRDMMAQAGMPSWLVEAGLAVFAHAREGGEAAVDPTLTKIIGRSATTLSEFVERNRDAWQ